MHDIFQNWEFADYTYIKNKSNGKTLYDKGYYIEDSLPASAILELEKLYTTHHQFDDKGMYNTLYSKDIDHRKLIHNELSKILEGYLDKQFEGYKILYSVFFLKGPATNSYLLTHQDLSIVDEEKYSYIHLWIPLDNITTQNGAICIIEKSHHLYAPYRGMSIPFSCINIQDNIKKYLKPIELNKGETLVFDPKTLHCSLPNKTNKTRPVVVVILAPMESNIQVCYQNPMTNKIEVIAQEDDFFLTSHHFIDSSKERPSTGKHTKFVDYIPHLYTKDEFEELAKRLNFKVENELTEVMNTDTKMYRIPKKAKKTRFIDWIKSKI